MAELNNTKTLLVALKGDKGDKGESARPNGVDISTNILAFQEDKGIYVATDTGHWYYWNGNAYADGGVYQAAVNEGYIDFLDGETGSLLTRLQAEGNKQNTVVLPSTNGLILTREVIESAYFDKQLTQLINLNLLTKGYYVSFDSGKLSINSSYFVTSYISVDPSWNKIYFKYAVQHYCFYDESLTFIDITDNDNGAVFSTNIPSNAAYIRISFPDSQANDFAASIYEGDFGKVPVQVKSDFLPQNIKAYDTNFYKTNRTQLFDKSTLIDGYLIYLFNGIQTELSNWCCCDYVKVDPSWGYIYFNIAQEHFAFYTKDKAFIDINDNKSGPITQCPIPSNAAYLRLSCYKSDANNFIVSSVKGYFEDKKSSMGIAPEHQQFDSNKSPLINRSANYLIDKNKCIKGRYVSLFDGIESDNEGMYASPYIELDSSWTTLYFNYAVQHFAFYDENGNFLPDSHTETYPSVKSIDIPSSAKYFRISINKYDINDFNVTAIQNSYGTCTHSLKDEFRARNILYIGNNGDITNLLDGFDTAFNIGNLDVYITDGTYDLIQLGVLTRNEYYGNYRGILLGNNNRYFFSANSKLLCNYTGDDTSVKSGFAPFNSSNNGGSFELHGLNIEGSGIRYLIHDDSGGNEMVIGGRLSRHLYKNCHMVKSVNPTYELPPCVGMGSYINSEIIFENCYFKSYNPSSPNDIMNDLEWHGNHGTTEYAQNGHTKLYFVNCYFNSRVGIHDPIPELWKNTIFYTGNSAREDINIYGSASFDNFEIIKWNNEIRTQ